MLLAALLLGGCEQSETLADWDPLEVPPPLQAALDRELGDQAPELMVITTRPNDETSSLGWTCGMLTSKRNDATRFFVYDTAIDDLRLEPPLPDQPTREDGLRLLAFMQYKAPCDK